jgi:hypothetical protein
MGYGIQRLIKMSEYYFINQRIVTLENSVVLGKIDSDVVLDPIDLLNGAKLSLPPTYINIELSETSGDYYPDIISSVITLYSNKVKTCLDNCGIDNIDYFPVNLMDTKTSTINKDYWFANICGRISCLDVANSDTKKSAAGRFKLKSFCIDETLTNGAEIFRLHERGRLVIIHERIQKELEKVGLNGVILENTRNYDGHGM